MQPVHYDGHIYVYGAMGLDGGNALILAQHEGVD